MRHVCFSIGNRNIALGIFRFRPFFCLGAEEYRAAEASQLHRAVSFSLARAARASAANSRARLNGKSIRRARGSPGESSLARMHTRTRAQRRTFVRPSAREIFASLGQNNALEFRRDNFVAPRSRHSYRRKRGSDFSYI